MQTRRRASIIRYWLRHSALAVAIATTIATGTGLTTTVQAAVTTADFSDLVQQVTPGVARVMSLRA